MTTWTTDKYFKNAKACFAENLEALPAPALGMPRTGQALVLWNLSRGLHDLTCAMEKTLEDLESRIRHLEVGRQQSK